jgi:hypothetical protein
MCDMRSDSSDDWSHDQDESRFDPGTFAAWIRMSPQNVLAFLLDVAVTKELQGLDARHLIDLDIVVARAKADLTSGNIGDSDDGMDTCRQFNRSP